MVERKQVLQTRGVALLVLERVDERQLLLDEGLVATRQRFEHLVDLPAQLRLLTGEPQRTLVHGVDGAGDLADFFLRVNADRRE